jgi:small-conductance mechanosensitive channel
VALLESALQGLASMTPFLTAVAIILLVLVLTNRFLIRRAKAAGNGQQFARQITMLILSVIGLIAIIIALPIDLGTRDKLLGLLGVALTAVITLASTTFVSNAMSGVLLRSLGNFRSGDFVRVGDQFGRVTVRGLFHTEIQTEDRDLSTLPNYYLVSNPVKVVRSSGTIVSAKVSLGYDLPHGKVEALLIKAAEAAELQEPFAQVLDLGDFSVTYRIAGFLPDVKHLLSARSKLRLAMLDTLHEAGIEIVSPTFMIQRPQAQPIKAIPPVSLASDEDEKPVSEGAPEAIMFDKADAAERIETLQKERQALLEDITQLENELKHADDGTRARRERGLSYRKQRLESIDRYLEQASEEIKNEE